MTTLPATSGGPVDTPDADADLERKGRERNRLGNLVHDPPRHSLGSVAVEAVAQDDAELIAAKPRHRSSFRNLRQALGNHLENFVAEPVTVDIIDRLEIIEVHDEERAGLALRQIASPFVEILDEPAAVGKSGEHVVAGQLMRLGLGLPP